VRRLSDSISFPASTLLLAFLFFCVPVSAQKGGSGSGAPGSDAHAPPNFSIRGRVIDAHDRAQLENVRVELRTFTGATVGTDMTRQGGDFQFMRVGVGSYDIFVQQAGYRTAVLRLDVAESSLGLTINLEPIESKGDTLQPRAPPVSARELSIPRKAHEAMEKGLLLLNDKSDYRGSIKQFERAIREYPGYFEAYSAMGIAYLQTGNNASAEAPLRKALELSQYQDVEAMSWFATLLNGTLRFVDAESLARRGLALTPDSWHLDVELARALVGLHRPAEAEKYAREASKSQPNNALLYLVLANVHSQLGNGSALQDDLTNYLRLIPTGSVADNVRVELKHAQDHLAEQKQNAAALTPAAVEITTKTETLDARVADAAAGNAPEISSAGKELKPVIWPPMNVDSAIPPVSQNVACPLQQVLKGARQRVQELLDNLDRFTATEVIDSSEIGVDGRASRSVEYTYNYLAAVSLSRDGDLRFDENRQTVGKENATPLPVRTVGLAVGAAVFHPLRLDDFEIACEGLGEWHGKPAWQLHFGQRPDKPSRFQAVFANGNWYDVRLKGRAWVAQQTSQIEHIDFDLLDIISPIRLQTEHLSLDYSAVDFPKRKIQLWLPQSASFYIDVDGHRFLNRHELSNFVLFAVDTNQEIKNPRKPVE
jgi:tetratricopeptide (TPR) repeat protein